MKNLILLALFIFSAGVFSCKKKEPTPTPVPPLTDSLLRGYSLSGLHDVTVSDTNVLLPLDIKKDSTLEENLTLSVLNLPAGVTVEITPASGKPTFAAVAKFIPSGTVTPGTYRAKMVLTTSSGKKKPYDFNVIIPAFVDLTGDISFDKTLNAAIKYTLKGFVYVTKSAKLTIPSGTIIMGDRDTRGTLIITRGAKIDAQGTASRPIVFTSAQAAGSRSAGDWGGVVILGKAPVNAAGGEAKMEGGLVSTGGGTEQDYMWYGGTDPADNSGIMKYVRIEFAGVAFTPDNEINALSLGGVGTGTTLSYIQVYRCGDDAFEWFGGTVNADHLVATYTWDDDFDTDLGFSGNIQYGVAHRYKALADISGSNGFESDNDANGTTNNPQTKATFSNMTIVGPITSGNSTTGINAQFQNGVQLRRNSSQSVRNSIIIGFPTGVYIDGSKGTPTHKNLGSGSDGSLAFKNNIIAGCATTWKVSGLSGSAADDAIWAAFKGQASNTVITNAESVVLQDPNKFSSALGSVTGRPNFLLSASSPALSGTDFTGMNSFFSIVSFRGAFDASNDWTSGWTNWAAETTTY